MQVFFFPNDEWHFEWELLVFLFPQGCTLTLLIALGLWCCYSSCPFSRYRPWALSFHVHKPWNSQIAGLLNMRFDLIQVTWSQVHLGHIVLHFTSFATRRPGGFNTTNFTKVTGSQVPFSFTLSAMRPSDWEKLWLIWGSHDYALDVGCDLNRSQCRDFNPFAASFALPISWPGDPLCLGCNHILDDEMVLILPLRASDGHSRSRNAYIFISYQFFRKRILLVINKACAMWQSHSL